MKKKIVIFHPTLASYRVDFFNSLAKSHNCTYYFNYRDDKSFLFSQSDLIDQCIFEPKYITKGFKFYGRTFRFGLLKILKNELPEVVICSEYEPVTIFIFFYKMIFNMSFELYTMSDDSINDSKERRGIRAFVRNLISKNIDGVIFASKDVCNWFYSNMSTKVQTFEVPIIHDDERFRVDLKASLEIANRNIEKYNLFGKNVMLFVGRLVQVKNLTFLVNTLSKLENDNWRIIIVGDGILEKELKTRSEQLNLSDKILFVGSRQKLDLLAWYNVAQIFIFPSTFERFGAVVNEALLGGCQVLCSELAGASTLINESNGKIFNPFDEVGLQNMINAWLKETGPIKSELKKIRNSKMPFTFENKIDIFIKCFS